MRRQGQHGLASDRSSEGRGVEQMNGAVTAHLDVHLGLFDHIVDNLDRRRHQLHVVRLVRRQRIGATVLLHDPQSAGETGVSGPLPPGSFDLAFKREEEPLPTFKKW